MYSPKKNFCGLLPALLFFFGSFSNLNSQNKFDYVTSLKADALHICSDRSGSTYIFSLGLEDSVFTYGTTNFPFKTGGEQAPYILKLDGQGNPLWLKIIGNSRVNPNHIALDADGNIIIGGFFYGDQEFPQTDFDPGPGTYNLKPVENTFNTGFICKYDANGNILWGGVFGPSGQGEVTVQYITTDKENNIIMGGYCAGWVDMDPGPGAAMLNSSLGVSTAFVCKVNDKGEYLWHRGIGPADLHVLHQVEADSKGNIYGRFGYNSPELYKLSSDGDLLWKRQTTPAASLYESKYFSLDANDDLYLSTWPRFFFNGEFDFDPGPTTCTLSADKGMALLKYRDNTLLWTRQFNVGSQDHLVTDGIDVFLTGTDMRDYKAGHPYYMIVNGDGNIKCMETYTGTSLGMTRIAILSPGNLLIKGTYSFSNYQGATIYQAEICADISSLSEITMQKEISLYPSPAHDLLHTGVLLQDESVCVYDLTGAKIKVNCHGEALNVSALTGGVYFLKAKTNEGVEVRGAFVKQ